MQCWILVSPGMGVVMEGDVVVCGCRWRFTVGQILPRLIPKIQQEHISPHLSPIFFCPLPVGIFRRKERSLWQWIDLSNRSIRDGSVLRAAPGGRSPSTNPPQGLKSRRLLKKWLISLVGFFKKILDLVNLCDFFLFSMIRMLKNKLPAFFKNFLYVIFR